MLLPNVRQNVIKQKSPNKFPSWCLLRSACHVSFFMLEKIEVIATVLIILLLLTNMWKVHLYLNKKIAECLEICAICIFRILHSLFNNSIRKKTHIKNLNLIPFPFCTALQRALPFRQQQRILSSPRQLFLTTTSDFPEGVGWWEPATAVTVAGKTPSVPEQLPVTVWPQGDTLENRKRLLGKLSFLSSAGEEQSHIMLDRLHLLYHRVALWGTLGQV